ncbi:MAG: TetR/AcrR family transcriptional regulator [Ilumatobacteraceae bacterium]
MASRSAARSAGGKRPAATARPNGGRVGRPTDADAAQTRRRLLEAAVEAFGETGLSRTSLRHIAERAGLTAGTLYHHYPTKEALYIEAYEWVVAQIQLECYDATVGLTHPQERLSAVLDRLHDLTKRRPATVRFVVWVWVEHIDQSSHRVTGVAGITAFMEMIADEGVRRGDLDPADRDAFLGVAASMMYGVLLIAFTGRTQVDLATAGLNRALADQLFLAPRTPPATTKRDGRRPSAAG